MEILNKYKRWKYPAIVLSDNIWDFVLSLDGTTYDYVPVNGNNTTECLSAYIDASDDACFENGCVVSKSEFTWDEAINSAVTLSDIGFTAMDNGLILFDKDTISDFDFYKLLTCTELPLTSGDTRLTLRPVSGNTDVYSYGLSKEDKYIAFKGGFLQGFFKIEGQDYKILPDSVTNEIGFEFTIRPKDYIVRKNTLNSFYPDNRGIFFYIGTRAENKFARMHGANLDGYPDRELSAQTTCADYFADDYINFDDDECPVNGYGSLDYDFLADYLSEKESCKDLESGETFVLSAQTITDSNGDIVSSAITKSFFTDNKYLLFNRTKDGFTVDTWHEGDVMEIYDVVNEIDTNLYLVMNRTKSGLTVNDIDKLRTGEIRYDLATDTLIPNPSGMTTVGKYDLIKDITNNAFALKVNDDMSIGYKYLVKDCDVEEGWSIREESTFSNVIEKDKWSVVYVKIKSMNGLVDHCGNKYGKDKLKIYIYVNGYLKFVSKEIDDFSFKALNDMVTRQQGVPYNISLGGGTQGLSESIWTKYKESFPKVLPIEEQFAGTFLGDIKTFKIYTCPLEYNQIKNNYLYEINKIH